MPEHIAAQSFYFTLQQVVNQTLNEAVGELRPNKQRVVSKQRFRAWVEVQKRLL